MPRVLVIHRKPAIAAEHARRLSIEGLESAAYPVVGVSGLLRHVRTYQPDAILIDLTEMPSHGRAIGVLLREQKSTRHIPLVFLKGEPAKAALVRRVLPGAVFAAWPNVAPAIHKSIAEAPESPAPPNIAGVPLTQKLRVTKRSVIALLDAPADFRASLAPLPEGARISKQTDVANLILLFAKSAAALGSRLPALAPKIERGRVLWVCWPKRSSAEASDLTLLRIREMASFHNLVDSKLCSIDETWSATALSRRRSC